MDGVEDLSQWELAIARELFDETFYLSNYDDVKAAGSDAFDHFVRYGAREGRNPSANLDMRRYMAAHPGLAKSQAHPFAHYISHGLTTSWMSKVPAAEVHRALQASAPLSTLPTQTGRRGFLKQAELMEVLSGEVSRSPHSVLALSHTQYATVTGGTENVITAEAAALMKEGWCYLHICPELPAPGFFGELVDSGLGQVLVLTVDGKRRGQVHASVLSLAIQELRVHQPISLHLVIHHLMGFELGGVLSLAQACGNVPATVWIHDFFTLCVDPFLMRNDVQFCSAPQQDTTSCMVCAKGHARQLHLGRMRKLFRALRPTVIAPSAAVLALWRDANDYEFSDTAVVPLASVVLGGPALAQADEGRPLRVAFLGAPVWLKGWAVFQKLAAMLAGDPRYEFFRFGYGAAAHSNVLEVSVRVTAQDPEAMVRAVSAREIDVVVNWSACFESFSYVTCEALAAGASVVARMGAGNVPHLIASFDAARGTVVRTEVELLAFFLSGEAIALRDRRLHAGRVERTSATASRLLVHAQH